MRVLQAYFNTRYQLWGRTLRLDAARDSATEAEQRASAIQQNENKNFAVTHLFTPFCDEATRLKMVCFNINPNTKPRTADRRPYWWTYLASWEDNDALTADYVCTKLVGKPAEFAGGLEAGQPRKIGIITETKANNEFHAPAHSQRDEERCGYAGGEVEAPSTSPREPGYGDHSHARRGRHHDHLPRRVQHDDRAMSNAIDAYFPEWVHVAFSGPTSTLRPLLPPVTVTRLFGLRRGRSRAVQLVRCYRAYKAIDPATSRLRVCEYYWRPSSWWSPASRWRARTQRRVVRARSVRARSPRPPSLGHRGGYGPNDYSYVENYAEQCGTRRRPTPSMGSRAPTASPREAGVSVSASSTT